MADNKAADSDMAAASKLEPIADGTPSSLESSPEPDAAPEPSQEPAQPPKRKGGRKPIYATSEERKQRNRQAQAAFRERRTEYIKQLEATIKQNEETLAHLQQSQRTAADECLMLRYKNSLLERILLEKGIDVQAELQMKTGSPVLGPGFLHGTPPNPPQPPLQRKAVQRQQARRSQGQNFLPKLAPGQAPSEIAFSTASPHAHPTPSSHASSPTQMSTKSPMALAQGGMTPPTSAVLTQPTAQQFQRFSRSSQQQHHNQAFYQPQQTQAGTHRQPSRPGQVNYQTTTGGNTDNAAASQQGIPVSLPGPGVGPQSATAFYPSPFQKHFEQLDQEYDRPMLDEDDPVAADANTSPELQYHAQFEQKHGDQTDYYQQPQGIQQRQQMHHQQMTPQTHFEQSQLNPMTDHTTNPNDHFEVDPNDPMLDADPFGLSASMHYPTAYSFEPSQSTR